eukprot:13376397-Heterocapsa_arctica.AAC.1
MVYDPWAAELNLDTQDEISSQSASQALLFSPVRTPIREKRSGIGSGSYAGGSLPRRCFTQPDPDNCNATALSNNLILAQETFAEWELKGELAVHGAQEDSPFR